MKKIFANEVYAVIIKGFDKFREKLPILSGKRIAVIPLYIIFISIIAFLIYTIFDTMTIDFVVP